MTRYHIAINGEPAICRAQTEESCPRGGTHYDTLEKAVEAAHDARMNQVGSGELRRPLANKTPDEIDTDLAELYYKRYRIEADISMVEARIPGYQRELERVQASAHQFRIHDYERQLSSANERLDQLRAQRDALLIEAGPGESEFDYRGGWTRAFLARSKPGHVHRSMNCPSCNKGMRPTQFAWLTEYSGKSEAEVVADAGEHACTYCYPSAPVEVLNRPSKIKWEEPEAKARREAREAATAKRLEKAIFMPDGSEVLLRSRPNDRGVYHVKNAVGAEREAVEIMVSQHYSKTSQGISGTSEYKQLYADNLATLTTALAHKHGVSEDEIKKTLAAKFEAKRKRDKF